MSPNEMEAFYSSGYRLLQQGTEEPTEKDLLTQKARALGTIAMTAGRLPSVSRHLDLGSSSGALLEAVRDRFRCEGVGIEPGESYRRYSLARGLRVLPDLTDAIDVAEEPFDLVTAMHVLEHLPDPLKTLAQLRTRHMKPGAFLLVEVPNLAEHPCLEIAHVQAFAASSLKDAVRRAGFQVVWTRCHGGVRSPILRLYITLLARVIDRPSTGRYLPFAAHRTRVSRRIGVAKREFFTRLYPDWTWQSPEKALERRAATGRIR
ncbi:MAG TPA: class I SAM-dependent methyltransferase [Anaerolineales bacterium]|nr:class I SAM-dependent methyltransferase [Anaerolineales bacterium]